MQHYLDRLVSKAKKDAQIFIPYNERNDIKKLTKEENSNKQRIDILDDDIKKAKEDLDKMGSDELKELFFHNKGSLAKLQPFTETLLDKNGTNVSLPPDPIIKDADDWVNNNSKAGDNNYDDNFAKIRNAKIAAENITSKVSDAKQRIDHLLSTGKITNAEASSFNSEVEKMAKDESPLGRDIINKQADLDKLTQRNNMINNIKNDPLFEQKKDSEEVEKKLKDEKIDKNPGIKMDASFFQKAINTREGTFKKFVCKNNPVFVTNGLEVVPLVPSDDFAVNNIDKLTIGDGVNECNPTQLFNAASGLIDDNNRIPINISCFSFLPNGPMTVNKAFSVYDNLNVRGAGITFFSTNSASILPDSLVTTGGIEARVKQEAKLIADGIMKILKDVPIDRYKKFFLNFASSGLDNYALMLLVENILENVPEIKAKITMYNPLSRFGSRQNSNICEVLERIKSKQYMVNRIEKISINREHTDSKMANWFAGASVSTDLVKEIEKLDAFEVDSEIKTSNGDKHSSFFPKSEFKRLLKKFSKKTEPETTDRNSRYIFSKSSNNINEQHPSETLKITYKPIKQDDVDDVVNKINKTKKKNKDNANYTYIPLERLPSDGQRQKKINPFLVVFFAILLPILGAIIYIEVLEWQNKKRRQINNNSDAISGYLMSNGKPRKI